MIHLTLSVAFKALQLLGLGIVYMKAFEYITNGIKEMKRKIDKEVKP